MLDNFREWLSDNLRYILLGAAGLLLIVIIVFAVRLVGSFGKKDSNSPANNQNTQETGNLSGSVKDDADTSGEDASADPDENVSNAGNTSSSGTTNTSDTAGSTSSGDLVRNQTDILTFVTSYYNARAEKDYDTLATLSEVFDDTTKSEVQNEDTAVESYSNIMTYSKAGLTDGSYVVYAYFDAKLTGVTTLAPCLRELYLITDSEGNLVIADLDAEQEAFIEEARTDDDVQALITDVDNKLANVKASDETLASYLDSGSGSSGQQDPDGSDSDNTGDSGTSSGTAAATTTVNVRSEPSTDGAILASLYAGMEVEVIDNTDTGWTHIRYTYEGSTIEGYVSTQYLN